MGFLDFWQGAALLAGVAVVFAATVLRIGMREKDLPPGKSFHGRLHCGLHFRGHLPDGFWWFRTSDRANSGQLTSDDGEALSHV